MNARRQTEDLLEEIKRHTGLSFSIDLDNEDEEQAIAVLEQFLEPYRRQGKASEFWTACLKGELPQDDMEKGIRQYHLKETTKALVFLVCFPQGYDETAVTVIRDLSNDDDRILRMDENHIALLQFPVRAVTAKKLYETAAMLADTLLADAMLPVCVSYDGCVERLSALADSYAKAMLAENIGRTFRSSGRVYDYHRLGLGKLISKLTREDCREYLEDHLGNFRFEDLDAEMSSTVHAFFESGLSVANTAKALFIHRNPLMYRLNKLEKLSGLDLRDFDDAVAARIAMLMEAYLR